ncbi:MAG: hypothetical protein P8K80_02215 [Phycisphaerales bacterium]|nr:hypothetical protein [Phycisphaerales bacterium]
MARWRGWVAPAFVACLLASSVAQARTIQVPGTYVTIQEAIDVAEAGDEIHVAPGRYMESINPGGKAIRIFATEGPRLTFLDGTGQHNSVIRCVSGEGAGTIIEGFRVVSGTGDPSFYGPEATIGGGIVAMASSPVIRNCVIEGNNASYNGGGMFNGSGSDVKLDGCRFMKNAAEKGGAIFNIESSPQILLCEFESNSARYAGGGIYNANQSEPSIKDCNFTLNLATYNGGAIYNYDSTPTISNCVFFNNAATYKGGAIYHGYRSGTLIEDGTSRFQTDNDDIAGGGYLMSVANPKGACCIGGACIEVEEAPCVKAGGSWAGANTNCKETLANFCPKPQAGDMNRDGLVDINDMAILMNVWGTRRQGSASRPRR